MQSLFEQGEKSPHLRGQRCSNCSRVAFPPNPYGCESCGMSGDVVIDEKLAGQGRLRAFVTTNHANQRNIPVPYTVASIELEGGPVIRALMVQPGSEGLRVNDTVEAVVIISGANDSAAEPVHELRFQLAEAR